MPLCLNSEVPGASDSCTLFLSISRVPESDDEQASEVIDVQSRGVQHDYFHFNTRSSTTLWDTALRRTYNVSKIYDQCAVKALRNGIDSVSHATSSLACEISIGFNC